MAGFNILRDLDRLAEPALFPIGRMEFEQGHRGLIERCRAQAARYDDEAASVRIWHQDQLAEHVGRGPKFGFPFFELDRLRADEVYQANRLDGYIVASGWARQVALDSGVTVPIHVVPLGVDRTVFHENVKADRLDPDHTVFFTVGKFEVRKGHDLLLSAFNRAFGRTDRVVLRMLSYNPFIGSKNDEWARRFKGSKLGDSIEIVPGRLESQHDVARFMQMGDVGVFPARAEGWNLDLLEAMSLGKPVIASNYSAHTEFCTDENATLIPIGGLEEARDGVWFHGEGRWAAPDEDALVEALREHHRRHQAGGPGVNHAGIATARRLSWENTAHALLEAIA